MSLLSTESGLCGGTHKTQGCGAQSYSRWQISCSTHVMQKLHDITFDRRGNPLRVVSSLESANLMRRFIDYTHAKCRNRYNFHNDWPKEIVSNN